MKKVTATKRRTYKKHRYANLCSLKDNIFTK